MILIRQPGVACQSTTKIRQSDSQVSGKKTKINPCMYFTSLDRLCPRPPGFPFESELSR